MSKHTREYSCIGWWDQRRLSGLMDQDLSDVESFVTLPSFWTPGRGDAP